MMKRLTLVNKDPNKMCCNLYAPQFDFNQDQSIFEF